MDGNRPRPRSLVVQLLASLGAAAGLAMLAWWLFPPDLKPPDRAQSFQGEAARLIVDGASTSDIQVRMVSGHLGSESQEWALTYLRDIGNESLPMLVDGRFSILVQGEFDSQTTATLVVNDDPAAGMRYFDECIAFSADTATGTTTQIEPQQDPVEVYGWKLSPRGWGDPSTTIRAVQGAYSWHLQRPADLFVVHCLDDRDPYLTGSVRYGTIEFPRVAVLLSGQRIYPRYRAHQSLREYPLDLMSLNGSELEQGFSGTYSLSAAKFEAVGEQEQLYTEDILDLTTYIQDDEWHEDVDVSRLRSSAVAPESDAVLGVEFSLASRWTQFQSLSADGDRQRAALLAGVALGLLVSVLAYAGRVIFTLAAIRR